MRPAPRRIRLASRSRTRRKHSGNSADTTFPMHAAAYRGAIIRVRRTPAAELPRNRTPAPAHIPCVEGTYLTGWWVIHGRQLPQRIVCRRHAARWHARGCTWLLRCLATAGHHQRLRSGAAYERVATLRGVAAIVRGSESTIMASVAAGVMLAARAAACSWVHGFKVQGLAVMAYEWRRNAAWVRSGLAGGIGRGCAAIGATAAGVWRMESSV
jgi:aminoglycoside phosphotransferase